MTHPPTGREAISMGMQSRWARWSAVATLVIGITACVDQMPTTVGLRPESGISGDLLPTVASVTVYPYTFTLQVGQTKQLVGLARDASGTTLALKDRVISWVSSNPKVATVGATGVVKALAAGSTTITNTVDGLSGSATIKVTVGSVSVSPSSATINVGSAIALTATPKSASGSPLSGYTAHWTSANPAVATVVNGLVTGVSAGTVTISASAGGKTGTATITVVVPVARVEVAPSPATVTVGSFVALTATPRDAGGNLVSGYSLAWSSSDPAIATIVEGSVKGIAVGEVTVSAAAGGQIGTTTVTVTAAAEPPPPNAVASVTLYPSTATLAVGESKQLVLLARNSAGVTLSLTGRTVTWTSANIAIATVSSTGIVKAKAAGSVRITVDVDGARGFADITVY
jgi:trimeric autotransporter adhesin